MANNFNGPLWKYILEDHPEMLRGMPLHHREQLVQQMLKDTTPSGQPVPRLSPPKRPTRKR